MQYEQISLLTITPTYSQHSIKHDPYWDEIVKEPEQPVLTVENDESLLTVENEESLLTVENEESLLTVENEEDQDITVSKITTVSKRPKGNGTGRIQFRSLNKSGKVYKQAWYDYQLHCDGNKTISRSKYIPKRLLPKIEELEASKACVMDILDVLNGKGEKE